MTRTPSEVIEAIKRYQPTDGNWLALDTLLNELFQSSSPADGIDAMLGIFERFPNEDGAGVFWSIVHGLESLPGYEDKLIESMCKARSDFSLIMLKRLINSHDIESSKINLVRLAQLLEELNENNLVELDLRRLAEKQSSFITYGNNGRRFTIVISRDNAPREERVAFRTQDGLKVIRLKKGKYILMSEFLGYQFLKSDSPDAP